MVQKAFLEVLRKSKRQQHLVDSRDKFNFELVRWTIYKEKREKYIDQYIYLFKKRKLVIALINVIRLHFAVRRFRQI